MGVKQSHVLQDRRRLSRISTKMVCRFSADRHEGDYEALMLDLSAEGAFLSSAFLPAPQSKVFITLVADCLKEPLTLEGTVMRNVDETPLMLQATVRRSISAASEYGGVCQFGVEFENPPPGLTRLISSISEEHRSVSKNSEQEPDI